MEKMIFLFGRLDSVTRPYFRDHYIADHSPLGVRNCLLLHGYRVNLVETPSVVDSVTEIWSDKLTDFFDADKCYESPERSQEVMADHNTFIGAQISFRVEETVMVDGPDAGPIGERAAGAKQVTLYRKGDQVGEPPAGATKVLDNHVVEMLFTDGGFPEADTASLSEISLIRMVWTDSAESLASTGADSLLVNEYLWITPRAMASA